MHCPGHRDKYITNNLQYIIITNNLKKLRSGCVFIILTGLYVRQLSPCVCLPVGFGIHLISIHMQCYDNPPYYSKYKSQQYVGQVVYLTIAFYHSQYMSFIQ